MQSNVSWINRMGYLLTILITTVAMRTPGNQAWYIILVALFVVVLDGAYLVSHATD